MRKRLVVATRRSALALAQTRALIQELTQLHPGLLVDELGVTTTGDRIPSRSLSELGGKGVFVKEIEEALLDGRADVAVHSLKDLPMDLGAGLTLGCVPCRADPRDVLVTRTGHKLLTLPLRARIGTESLRRQVQLRALRPDLDLIPLRGNVDTRLRRSQTGEVDGVVLAKAGLMRLGLAECIAETLEPDLCLPAVGQGALGIEWRTNDADLFRLMAPLVHPETLTAVTAERAVMRAVGGNCHLPMAAYAERQRNQLWLRALLAEPDGSRPRRDALRQPWPESLAAAEAMGEELGRRMRAS